MSWWALVLQLLIVTAAAGQSTEQEYPAPVTESNISGTIRARDIGDSRVTTHYWAFSGDQGDIFINVVTQNFAGDIDIYMADGLRPLAKMVAFADAEPTETGRVIYMRQPGRLLLRVQGRSPNDDPATYRIKFAGSFVALAPAKPSKPPTVGDLSDSGIAVSSSGAIIRQPPKPKATPIPTPERNSVGVTPSAVLEKNRPSTKSKSSEKQASDVETVFGGKTSKGSAKKASGTPERKPEEKPNASASETATKPIAAKKEAEPDPMANVRLIVSFKDGHTVERPMSEVVRFIYANGFLTVTLKDGKTYRYAMTDLASVNVQ